AQFAGSLQERTEQLVQHLRQIFGQVLGFAPESLPPEMNLLDSGLDSLRVMELLSGIRQSLNVVLSPAEFFARPTLAGLAADLAEKLKQGEPDIRQSSAPAESALVSTPPPQSVPAKGNSPLVVLHTPGVRVPIFCIHPAGGQVTAYLRLQS